MALFAPNWSVSQEIHVGDTISDNGFILPNELWKQPGVGANRWEGIELYVNGHQVWWTITSVAYTDSQKGIVPVKKGDAITARCWYAPQTDGRDQTTCQPSDLEFLTIVIYFVK